MTYYGYFLDYPWLHLIEAKNIKDVNIMGAYIESFSFERASAEPFFILSASIDISTVLSGIGWLSLIDVLSIKYGFIDVLLNLIELYGSLATIIDWF